MGKVIVVNDLMQSNYRYECTAPQGEVYDDGFDPDLTPKEMLELGIFGGKYLNDCKSEYPADWFKNAILSSEKHDASLNYFKVNASQSLSAWRHKGWISQYDPRGWFQWYCRYYMGRRIPDEDMRQIRRWKMMTRHIAQIRKNCKVGDISCRPVQKQALLHWAYDSRMF
jgi:hypothetical protein